MGFEFGKLDLIRMPNLKRFQQERKSRGSYSGM
jgi:hypothetical protein